MAVRLAQADEAHRAERQRIKERVLQIDQLAAEAEVCTLEGQIVICSVCTCCQCAILWTGTHLYRLHSCTVCHTSLVVHISRWRKNECERATQCRSDSTTPLLLLRPPPPM